MKPDLEYIYSELELQPNCSLEEFQRAYRRRIGELHPDRPREMPRSPENAAALRNLIRMYAMVTRFHRRYGRMPGGHSSTMRGFGLTQIPLRDRSDSPPADDSAGSDDSRVRSTLMLVALFIALLVLLASWSWLMMQGAN